VWGRAFLARWKLLEQGGVILPNLAAMQDTMESEHQEARGIGYVLAFSFGGALMVFAVAWLVIAM